MDNLTFTQIANLANIVYIQDTYEMNKEISDYIGNCEIKNIYIKETDTEGAIVKLSDNLSLVLFAGSESLKDFIIDSLCTPNRYIRGGYIHRGFLKCHNSISRNLPNIINNNDNFIIDRYSKLICIGHSLGAQCALFAADILKSKLGFTNIEVVTFGCPNGWSSDACEMYESRIHDVYHFDNKFDYVTMAMDMSTDIPYGDHKIHINGGYGHMMYKYIKGVEKWENE